MFPTSTALSFLHLKSFLRSQAPSKYATFSINFAGFWMQIDWLVNELNEAD